MVEDTIGKYYQYHIGIFHLFIRMCLYQCKFLRKAKLSKVSNISFSDNFTYVLNGSSISLYLNPEDKGRTQQWINYLLIVYKKNVINKLKVNKKHRKQYQMIVWTVNGLVFIWEGPPSWKSSFIPLTYLRPILQFYMYPPKTLERLSFSDVFRG